MAFTIAGILVSGPAHPPLPPPPAAAAAHVLIFLGRVSFEVGVDKEMA